MVGIQRGLAVAVLNVPFIDGERGLAFTLWPDTTPELDRVPNYPLGEDHPGAIYLQPKDKR